MTFDDQLPHPGAMAALQAKADSQGAHAFFDDPIDVRRTLIAKRLIDEILDRWLAYRAQPWAARPEQTLAGMMNYQIGRLERLSKGA